MAETPDIRSQVRSALNALKKGAISADQLVAALDALLNDDPPAADDPPPMAANAAHAPAGSDSATATFTSERNHDKSTSLRTATDRDAGRFRVLKRHAQGGLGEVFLAVDAELNRHVALKELLEGRADDPGARARFLREAEINGRLEHPGIVPVHSLGRHKDGRPYYAMRFIEGETLQTAIERCRSDHTRGEADDLDFQGLIGAIIDSAYAVAYAHSRGVIHRDLKPQNIMLGPFGETLVMDWGAAKILEVAEGSPEGDAADVATDPELTDPGSLIGTPLYMSPEQARRDHAAVGAASDVYALGAILYTVLAGRSAFAGCAGAEVLKRVEKGIFPPPRKIRRTVDPALESICLKAMARKPSERHFSALAFAQALEAWRAALRVRVEHAAAVEETRLTQAQLALLKAQQAFERGAQPEGLTWLARGLALAPGKPVEPARLIRTSLSAWYLGARLLERSAQHGGGVSALAFSPDGRRLASGCDAGTIKIWDVARGAKLAGPIDLGGAIAGMAFLDSGETLGVARAEGLIEFRDPRRSEPVRPRLNAGKPIAFLAIDRTGSVVAAGGPGGCSLWKAGRRRGFTLVHEDADPVVGLACSDIGESVYVARRRGRVEAISAATGETLLVRDLGLDAVEAVAFDGLGERFVVVAQSRGRILDWRDEAATRDMPAHGGGKWSCDLSRDGAAALTAAADGSIRFWCGATGAAMSPRLAVGGPISTVVQSCDGRRFAVAGLDGKVRLGKTPEPVEGDPERISRWVETITRLELSGDDTPQPIASADLWDLRRRLDELGGPPIKERRRR